MKRKAIVIAALLGVGLSALFFTVNRKLSTVHQESEKSVYYCPMHPTYTSDKPGTCPICNMSLVKKEAAQPKTQDPHAQAPEQFKTICYLHNCDKIHQGKPCPMTVVAQPGEKVTCPVCGTHIAEAAPSPGEKKILYWTDPMILGFKSDKPGKSPMGMELVPVYAEEKGFVPSAAVPDGYALVLLTPQKRQLIGITTEAVQRRKLSKTIRTAGVIAHDPELYQAQQEFIQAFRAWEAAKAGQNAEAMKLGEELVQSSRLRLRHLGLNEELINEISTWTTPDHRLLLGGSGQFWVYASIYEYELAFVHPGQTVKVDVNAFAGEVFIGAVKAIDPMLDPMTRTARARVVIEDPKGILKPSMYVNVSIESDLGEGLAVAEPAVFSTGQQQIVFVDKGEGLLEPRKVGLGVKADGYYEVKEGLTEGESVVTSGNFLIDSESRLQGALQGAAGSHSH